MPWNKRIEMNFKNQLREQLNLPFHQKNKFFFLLSPLLFLFCLIVTTVAKYRRKKGYQHQNHVGEFPVICIGNFDMGGSGKSPIVQYFSKYFCEKNHFVGIFSRGIYANPVIVESTEKEKINSNINSNINLLSDENAEHFFLLKSFQNFSIYQNPNRYKSLTEFQKKNIQNKIVFLDDGLQHFSCPRTHNICIINPDLFLNSPPFPFPVGPYREGFGRKNLLELHKNVDFRIWSRTTKDKWDSFLEKLKLIESQFSFPLHFEKDKIAVYDIHYEKIENEIIEPLNEQNIRKISEKFQLSKQNVGLFCGIANPQQFLNETQKNWNFTFSQPLFLNDHEPFNLILKKYIENHSILFMTKKDYARYFKELSIDTDKIYIVAHVNLTILNFNQEVVQWNFKQKIKQKNSVKM